MGYSKIFDLITKSKLVLQTYIGTGYLETLTCNIPTVIFANINECLLDEQTIKDLEELRKKIFFLMTEMKQQSLLTKYGKMFPHGGLINLLKKHEKIFA